MESPYVSQASVMTVWSVRETTDEIALDQRQQQPSRSKICASSLQQQRREVLNPLRRRSNHLGATPWRLNLRVFVVPRSIDVAFGQDLDLCLGACSSGAIIRRRCAETDWLWFRPKRPGSDDSGFTRCCSPIDGLSDSSVFFHDPAIGPIRLCASWISPVRAVARATLSCEVM